jgi:hypothetical protein
VDFKTILARHMKRINSLRFRTWALLISILIMGMPDDIPGQDGQNALASGIGGPSVSGQSLLAADDPDDESFGRCEISPEKQTSEHQIKGAFDYFVSTGIECPDSSVLRQFQSPELIFSLEILPPRPARAPPSLL